MADVLLSIAAQLLDATCFVPDAERAISALTQGERVTGRMALKTAAAQSYHRTTGRYLTRPGDLLEGPSREFPLRTPRPAIERIDLEALVAQRSDQPPAPTAPRPPAESHRELAVRSVIDVHLWNQAKWRGAGFAQNARGYPPFLALIFEDYEAATKIFALARADRPL
ncbi:MAG TPA: hypothetical protein VGB79_10575 [Allosphingosinicella sp.]|jgi:hypothetical protein